MNLTSAQIATFKSWLDANAAGLSDDDAAVLANQQASPSYLVWRSIVTREQVQTSAAFDWTRVDNLSVGKARIWDWMFNQTDSMPPYLGNYRTGINAVWVGTQADLDVRAAVNTVCQRLVTNYEKLFVVQTTTGPSQSGNRGSATNADTLGTGADGRPIEGTITFRDISVVRGS